MGAQNDFAVVVVGDVGELVEDIVFGSFPAGEGLVVQGKVLAESDISGVEELFEDGHGFY